MTLKELAIDHDYYAHGSNYYSTEAYGHYNTWADFYNNFFDADIDMNLIYRWDIFEQCPGNFSMQVVIIGQRKGIYLPIEIDRVEENDVPQIVEFLKPHFDKLLSIWKPLSKEFINHIEG